MAVELQNLWTKSGVTDDVAVVVVVTIVFQNFFLFFVLTASRRPRPDLCCMIELDQTSLEASEKVPATLGAGLPDVAELRGAEDAEDFPDRLDTRVQKTVSQGLQSP